MTQYRLKYSIPGHNKGEVIRFDNFWRWENGRPVMDSFRPEISEIFEEVKSDDEIIATWLHREIICEDKIKFEKGCGVVSREVAQFILSQNAINPEFLKTLREKA